MKKRILSLIVLATLAITGCGSSKPNEELDKFAEEIIVNPDGSVSEPEATTAPSDVPTEAPVDTQTETPTATPAEEEKYFVTFTATTTEGEAWNSEKFADSKLTMINVWATYCNPCLAEMPDLGELAAEYDAADFQIIGVVSDVMAEDDSKNIEYAKQLIEETKASYPHLLLNESLYMSFVGAISAVPTTFFVRQDGSMVGYLTGAMPKENWKTLIDELLLKEQ
ncbi:MAG: TlpA family protein disulfide reductase [Lachnospiraceae bacterium]|nr:TlpA family protein disulfide reductase [Lachnospiraceae bacterium]